MVVVTMFNMTRAQGRYKEKKERERQKHVISYLSIDTKLHKLLKKKVMSLLLCVKDVILLFGLPTERSAI
jgi:hypothetical protein